MSGIEVPTRVAAFRRSFHDLLRERLRSVVRNCSVSKVSRPSRHGIPAPVAKRKGPSSSWFCALRPHSLPLCFLPPVTTASRRQPATLCKGFGQTKCTAKTECLWNEDKAKCKLKKLARVPNESARS